jgi:hypothetical protein
MSPGRLSRHPSVRGLLAALLLSSVLGGCNEASGAAVGPGTELLARDESGAPITFRVDAVEKDGADEDGDVYLYSLSYRDPADGAYKTYCLPDREGKSFAIPLSGYWDSARRYVAQPEVITFACSNSPLAKCVRWGYKPWKTVKGVSLRDHHLACVRMTRADYCGDGRPHTRDGTLIDVYDRLGIQTRVERPDMVFEAAWGPEGAVYVSRPRIGTSLEKLVALCPERLQGRTALDAPALDVDAIHARWPEGLLFDDSKVIPEAP